MNASVLCFTENGKRTATRIGDALREGRCPAEEAVCVHIWCKKARQEAAPGIRPWAGSITDWTRARFEDSRLLVFVGAVGIAVRAIAPCLISKRTDPAVVCVDEKAAFVIPLASGHLGGGNRFARLLAGALGAIPVITTATDLNGKFAVDLFASENGLSLSDLALAKQISATVLDGSTVSFESEFPVDGPVPEELTILDAAAAPGAAAAALPKIRVGIHDPARAFCGSDASAAAGQGACLCLTPRIVTAGIGCRRGTDPKALEAFLRATLAREGIFEAALEKICSIRQKADEPALIFLSETFKVPFITFSAAELNALPGKFASSDFVRQTVGTDNVCERSAVLGSGSGRLILKKCAADGMTIALAVREWRGRF